MAELCFICEKLLSDDKTVNVSRGLQVLKNASIQRNDGKIDYLNTLSSVKVHINCRKQYTSEHSITAYKRRLEDDEPSTSSSPRRLRTEPFDFAKLCLICGQTADEGEEKRKHQKYKRVISKVQTINMKDNIIKRAVERGDSFGELVKSRVISEFDLIAAGAKYHTICMTKFFHSKPSKHEEPSRKDEIEVAMQEIFSFIENNEDSQFTLKELRDVPTQYLPDDATIISNLRQKYLSNIVITVKNRSFTIISFRDTQADLLSQKWYENKKKTPEEERLRIVEAAAAIIREDIRTSIVETKSYPPPSKMLNDINSEIPKTLLYFIQEVIMKNKKNSTENLNTKCTAISHAIMAASRPRSFSSQLLLGLSVFLHRRFGSRRLIDILYSLGFCASYNECMKYEFSAVSHPQPRILSESLIQYVGDNADINVNTLDGHNTLHIMGMIKIVTPKSAVILDERIKVCTTKPSAKELAALSHVPLLIYEKPIVPGYSKIQVQNLNNEVIEQMLNKVDFLWLYGKWRNISSLPGWNGYLEQLTKYNTNYSTSQVMFLPFINNPASNHDTIYTTLHCALNTAKKHGQKTCVITFDQPLYSKAREMIAAFDDNSDFSKIVIKLGGFHTLMSFLGCIGYIMDGSGIKEALSKIYALKSIDKMMDGHAYSRSIRAHTLLRLALSKIILEDMKFESDLLDTLTEQITTRIISYEDLEECIDTSSSSIEEFEKKLNELKARGPTAQLWIQYFELVTIALDFIRAERLGLFDEHLVALKKMLPYFHASGHFLYAKSAHLYLQDMIQLKNTMDQQAFHNFKNGFFTVRRTEKFNSGTWTDMIIEQSLMKSMKTEGGISRGRSTKESVLSTWIHCMYATNIICYEIEKFCDISLNSGEQHVDARDSRITRDNNDVSKLVDWFTLHNPFPITEQVVSIASGVVGNDQINCHKAHEIGLQSMAKMTGINFNEVKLKRIDKVLPISAVNKSIKIKDCKVIVDPLLLFQRITVNKKFESNLKDYLQYELSPYPTSLFDNDGMRKTTKSKLYKYMEPVHVELDEDNIIYIVDGGFLMHRVVWSKDDTFSIVLDKYVKYLQTHYGSSIVVVFDGYSDYCKNIKAMEQQRRTAALSISYEVSVDESMIVPISQEKFLSNRSNKKKLIEMLVEKLKTANIATKQAKNDADVLIVETAIAESEHQKTVVIVGDDIDLLVILIGRTQSHQQTIFFKKIGKGNVETKMYSSKSFEKYPRCKKHVLFLHAFSGCDTTSALFRKGKLAVIKMFEKNSNLDQLAELFQQKNSHPQLLFENGERILLQMYNAPKLEGSIDNLRYTQFIKLTKSNKPVQLSSLPPTSAAARQHINRVYYQTQIWLGNDLGPQDWGWSLQNETLGPVATLLPPAPEELLNSIFCNCKKGCSLSCGCRKVGLQCSSACGHCKGQACLNAPLYSNDQDDDNATDIFEMLETTVNTDDENDDDDQFDLQIEQLEEEEEEDDEE